MKRFIANQSSLTTRRHKLDSATIFRGFLLLDFQTRQNRTGQIKLLKQGSLRRDE